MYLEYFETTADDLLEECTWDKLLRERMRQPRAVDRGPSLNPDQACTMANMAWFEDLQRPVEVPLWDEPTKERMRKPVRTNGHEMNDEILNKLVAFSSLW